MTDEKLQEMALRISEIDNWNELSMAVSSSKENISVLEQKLMDATIRQGLLQLALIRFNDTKPLHDENCKCKECYY